VVIDCIVSSELKGYCNVLTKLQISCNEFQRRAETAKKKKYTVNNALKQNKIVE